jgi:hypothetical protein
VRSGERDRIRWSDLRPGLRQALRPWLTSAEALDTAVADVEAQIQGMVERLADERLEEKQASVEGARVDLDLERMAMESRLRAEFEAQVQALRDQANVGRAVRVLLGELAQALSFGAQEMRDDAAGE